MVVLQPSWRLSWYYYPVVFDSGLTSLETSWAVLLDCRIDSCFYQVWLTDCESRCVISRPRCSLPGLLWLQFPLLTRLSRTPLISSSWTLASVSFTCWLESAGSRLTLLEPEYCPTSLPVRISWGFVWSWLAPVLLRNSQCLYKVDKTILLWSSQF